MTQKTDTPATSPIRTAASTQEPAAGQGLVNEAKHALVDVAGLAATQAETSIKDTVSGTKEKAAEGLGSVVQALRGAGEGLGDEGAAVRGYVDQVADRVDSLSKYVQNREVSQIVSDVERMARREPALFIGGAFVLGLLTARFLKSTGHTDSASMAQGGQSGQILQLGQSGGGGQRVQGTQNMRGPTTQRSQAVQQRRATSPSTGGTGMSGGAGTNNGGNAGGGNSGGATGVGTGGSAGSGNPGGGASRS